MRDEIEIVMCNICKTNFKTSKPNCNLTACKCSNIYCKVTSEYIEVIGKSEDYTSINFTKSFIKND